MGLNEDMDWINKNYLEPIDVVLSKNFKISAAGGAVRADFKGGENMGFCTTANSFLMNAREREYAAQRIAILLEKAVGLSNEQIESMELYPTE